MHPRAIILLLVLHILSPLAVNGQDGSTTDSLNFKKMHLTQNKFVNNIFQQALNSVKKGSITGSEDGLLNGKSEDPYLPYQGKIIRHIYVEPYGFNRSFTDTSALDNSKMARLGGKLHRTTRKFVISDNLFIEENTALNAFKLADNERYIRSLEFIQDARIIIEKIPHCKDSVDVVVYTKDVFSIGGGGASDGLNHINLNLYDANFVGLGQRIEGSGLYDYNRVPNIAYGFLYRKTNLLHTFVDVTVGYSQMNNGNYTHVEETGEYISLSRRLVSPYSRFAGALTLSRNEAVNPYHVPDTLAHTYKFDFADVWAGYNIGIKKLTSTNNSIRDRRFLAVRYYNRNFIRVPIPAENVFDPVYNSSQAVLAQFTFFRQDYFKTQYIYGFGTTEDLPYGYNISVTAGWHKQLNLERPYAGLNASHYIATKRGDFVQLYLRAGGFLFQNKVQDGSFMIGATAFSHIMFLNSIKIRQYVNTSYSELYNRLTYAPLRIDNFYGLRGFLSDSASGAKRFSMQLETEFYLRYKFFGFQFAPFPYGDLTVLTPANSPLSKSSLYTSLGGGVRARNENLVFETIEMRAYFFPDAPKDMRGFKVIVNANIKYRYSSNFITPPDVVQLNSQ